MEELPGVNAQGKTLKEARENLKEALCLIILANRDLAIKSQANTHSTRFFAPLRMTDGVLPNSKTLTRRVIKNV